MNIEDVETKEDFIKFLKFLEKDFQKDYEANKNKPYGGSGEWQNWFVGNYLESIAAWLEDSGKYNNQKSIDWKDLAKIIESGKYYE